MNTPEVAALFVDLDLAREKLGVLNTAPHELAQLRAAIEETTAFDVVEVNNKLLECKPESGWKTEPLSGDDSVAYGSIASRNVAPLGFPSRR